MVRVPGTSGVSQGFHREATEEDVKMKTETGNELSTEVGSPTTTWKTPGSSDRQSAGRSSDDENEEGSAMDLEEKPRPPHQVPAGTPADRDANRNPLDEDPTSEAGDHDESQTWTDYRLESAFHNKSLHRLMHEDPYMKLMRPKPIGELQGPVKVPKEASDMLDAAKILMRMLKDAGIVLGSFDANELFDMEQSAIRETTLYLFARLASIVGSVVPVPQEPPPQLSVKLDRHTGTVSATRIRVSMISDLKKFSGKGHDEDGARSWFSKVKFAFVRDQAPDSEKCFVFGDLLARPARNWYWQLSRSTRCDWKGLAKSFQIQYCGRGARREHVDHFIETLDDRDLASQLALLRIPDADTLEETLRSQKRAKARQDKTVYGSIRPKPKAPAGAAPSANARAVRAVRVAANPSDSGSETSGSEGEGDSRKVYLAADVDRPPRSQSDPDPRRANSKPNTHREGHQSGQPNGEEPRKPCSHCGLAKHSDLGCWQRLTCEKCGKKGHPTDRCLFTYKACGEIHGAGECPLEEFYNLIRQWKLIRPIDNTRGIHDERTMAISTLHHVDEFGRSEVMMALNLLHGESRGYWKYHVRDKKFRQAKVTGKINSEKDTLLFDNGAEVSILVAAFARKVECYIDNSQELESEAVGKNPYTANGRTRVKLTLAGSLVYYFDVWVSPPTGGQDLILGMDFMAPAGIRLDLAGGSQVFRTKS
ncbi:unnamed protein product [Phytophthora fragariaefolia]|uniref:Unnamed protein product n=1 Tax=Phytophthora fragariaefolia TaxID=1490495 RepID=A0A9W6XVH2_9STRA|nr:unnamed protein product [Phytophthora fragariaefolia]